MSFHSTLFGKIVRYNWQNLWVPAIVLEEKDEETLKLFIIGPLNEQRENHVKRGEMPGMWEIIQP